MEKAKSEQVQGKGMGLISGAKHLIESWNGLGVKRP